MVNQYSQQKIVYLGTLLRYLFLMNFRTWRNTDIWKLRISLIIVTLGLMVGYCVNLSRIAPIDTFGLHQYFERADLYQKHITVMFIWLIPFTITMTGLIISFEAPKRFVSVVIDVWQNLPEWVYWGIIPLLFCVASAWTAKEIIGAVPRVFDAFNYYLQAQNFALGQFYAEAPPIPDLFRFPFIIIEDGKWYGSIYPGYSLFLAFGINLGAGWLTSPLLGAVALMLMYFAARDIFNDSIAKIVAILALFSPFFRMMSSIFMAHSASIVWVVLAIWMLWRWAERNESVSVYTPFMAGLALGGIYITRPQAGLVTLPLFIGYTVLKVRFCGWKRLAAFVFPMIVAILFLGFYNYQLTGDPMVNPRYYVDPDRSLGFGSDLGEPLPGGLRSGHDLIRGLQNSHLLLTLWNMELLGTGSLGALGMISAVILFLMVVKFKDKRLWFFASGIVFNSILYIFYYTPSPNFGPRYFAEIIPSSIILFAWGTWELARRSPRQTKYDQKPVGLTIFFILILAVQLTVMLPAHAKHYGILPEITQRHAISEPARPSVICVSENVYTMNIYTWNSPDLAGNIFVPMRGVVSFHQIETHFPGRDIYILDKDDEGNYRLASASVLNEVE